MAAGTGLELLVRVILSKVRRELVREYAPVQGRSIRAG
jgi:hypothetical protein